MKVKMLKNVTGLTIRGKKYGPFGKGHQYTTDKDAGSYMVAAGMATTAEDRASSRKGGDKA